MTSRNHPDDPGADFTHEPALQDRLSYDPVQRGATDFLNDLAQRYPDSQRALLHAATDPLLDDATALTYRSQWQPQDDPVTDWERTAHHRAEMPPWIKDDPAESATTITGIFNANLSHLDYSQAREAGQELAQMLATPVEHQLDAVQSNHTLMDLLDHKAPYAPEHLDMTKDSLAEGLAVNDHATVQAAIGNLASMQEQFNRIDTLLEIRTMMEHHDPDGDLAATNDQQPQGFLNRVHSLFRKFWGTDDLQAASGPPPAERLDHAVNEDSQERLQNHFQHHHITQDATQQILDFAQRFDPQGTHEERITWQVLHGERNLLNEEPHVRDQVAEAIVGQITKFDFPELQGYHDAADYLSQALIRPMTYTLLPEDRYEDQDLYDYTELTRYSLDFLSAHSDKDKQLSFLKESLNQIADRVHTLQGGHPDHQATPAFDRTTPRTPPAGTDYGPTGPDNQAEDHRSALDFAPDQAHSSFQLHHIPTESQARLLNFSTNFDPQNSYADSVAYHVVRGERNLLQEDSHVQDQVAAIIVDQVTKSDFPQQQDYHDIADDLSMVITRPMLHHTNEDWQDSLHIYGAVEMTKRSLDFLSSNSDQEKQLSQLRNSLAAITQYANTYGE